MIRTASVALVLLLAAAAHAELGKRTVQEKKLYENVYTVCIGVDGQSREDLIPPLRFAGNDAKAVNAVFVDRYGYDSQLLTGPDATRNNILKAIKFAAGGAEENDVVIVYFAGHGQTIVPVGAAPHEKVGYLIAYDTEVDFTQPISDVKVVDNQAVPMADVVRIISDSKAAHVLLILDCCFSGFAADLELGARSITPGERQMLTDLLSEPTRQVFTAGTSDQKSLEVKQLQHGLFTYHLVEELNKADDIYSLVQTFADVRGKVSAEAAKGSGRMTPQLRQLRQSNGDWVFIDKDISEDALTQYESKSRPKTTEQDYETYTASARSVEAEKGEGSLETDPEYVAKHEENERRAAMGDPVAMAALQYDYENGVGCKKDPERAFFWAQEAAKYDNTESKLGKRTLIHSYENGIGTPQNLAEAENLKDVLSITGGLLISDAISGNDSISNMSTEQKVGTVAAIGQNLGSIFGGSASAGSIGKLRHELREAAAKADADKVDDKLTKLEKALADLQTQSHNPEGKLAPDFAAELGKLYDQLAPPIKQARKWEGLGAFKKIEEELVKMDDAIVKLNALMP